MRKLIALLFVLVTFSPMVQAQDEPWKVTDFRAISTDLDAKVNYPVIDPNGNQCALIKIETGYSGFTFSTGTLQVMKAEKHPGEWWVYVQRGVRKITIGHAKGILRDWQFPETIKEGVVYLMKLKEGGSSEAAYTTAVAATTATSGFAVITSTPSGADVYIDDVWVGVTPFQKRYPMNTRLRVRCAKKMYHEDMALVTVSSLKTEQHFDLSQAYGSMRLTSEPSGANVFIDGESSPRGVTPITVTEVASGAVQVTFTKELYAPIKQIIGVQDGRTTDYFVKLAPTFADVTVNSLQGATIMIDGVDKGKSSFKGPLSEGLHEVEAILASHKMTKRQIDVVAGVPVNISLNPTPIYGALVVTSDPFECDVYIGGKNYGKTPLIIPDILIGEYNVEVRKSGYSTATEHVVIREGSEVEISPKLITGGDVLLSADANGSTIYVDGANVGVYNGTAIRMTLGNGSHSVYAVNASGDKSDVQSVTVTPGAAAVSVKLSFSADRVFTVKGVQFKMVEVKGGTFQMGATSEQGSEAYSDEKPVHSVTLSNYMIGQTEVTQELWQAVMGSNPSNFKGTQNPVEKVSWEDCQNFITKLNSLTGQNFRLPTEAEWEYAARGGNKSQGYKYSGSNNIGDIAWYDGNSSSKTHQVATKAPNELGLYDMSGNVYEWCQDRYNNSYYSSSPQNNPQGRPGSGSYRVFRGGGWLSNARSCRSSNRGYYAPDSRGNGLGLRLVLSLP